MVSLVVSADAPFLKQVSAPPGPASSRKKSPAAPVVAALTSVAFEVPVIFWMKILVVSSTQLYPWVEPALPATRTATPGKSVVAFSAVKVAWENCTGLKGLALQKAMSPVLAVPTKLFEVTLIPLLAMVQFAPMAPLARVALS